MESGALLQAQPVQGLHGAVTTAAKRYLEGTHRVRSPEATWEWIRPLLPAAGVTRVADVTALDRLGIPVFQAIRPLSRNISVSQGKATTAMGARVSAVMEAVELWHAEALDGLEQVELPVREMRTISDVPTASLPWLPGAPRLEAWPIPWVRASSLVSERSGWLPREMVELDFTVYPELKPRLFHRTSNGLASGNCREEALVHGLCEVVERHALYLAYHDPARRVPVDVSKADAPFCRGLLERLGDAGARLAVYDLTWEAGVPVVAADLCLPDLPRIFSGSGCHPAPEVALSRALTEAVQSRLTVISGARDDLDLDEVPLPPYQAYEGFAEPVAERVLGDLPDVAADDVGRDLETVAERLARLGHEPFGVDLTRAAVGVPVVRVFAPGLGEWHD